MKPNIQSVKKYIIGYRCSAGIAHNKILAKLVCGMNKPDKQTVLPKHSINILYSTLSIKKVKHLGGKFGDTVCDTLKISKMCQLQEYTLKELQARFDEKNGIWLYNIARGIDLEPVQAKFNPKSIGCCKQLRGKSALTDLESLKKWLADLGQEIEDRLEKDAVENNRTPKQMVVSFSTSLADGRDISSSRSYNFSPEDELCGSLFSSKALELVMETTEGTKLQGDETNRQLKAPIKFLGISVGKFEDNTENKKIKKILDYFAAGSSKEIPLKTKDDEKVELRAPEIEKNKDKRGKEYLLQKFFQQTDKKQEDKLQEIYVKDTSNGAVIEASLEKQESFFTRLLKNKDTKIPFDNNPPIPLPVTAPDKQHPPETACDIINNGENSNDTTYSTSTIDNEINKSIALFEEDPTDVNRVSNMRQLLNSTIINEDESETMSEKSCEDNKSNHDVTNLNNKLVQSTNSNSRENFGISSKPKTIQNNLETFQCPECKKNVGVHDLDIHADYHLALKIRDEERLQARIAQSDKNTSKSIRQNEEIRKKKIAQEALPSKNEISIASFLVKIDNSVPTEICAECGKKISKEKFAEHLDFHEAQKISRELNKRSIPTISACSTTGKRKRVCVSPSKKQKVPCKSIDSFFR